MENIADLEPGELAELVAGLPPGPLAELLNANRRGFDALVGLSFSHASPQHVRGTLQTEEKHVQPYGLVHGGVYASLAESACSVGAGICALPSGLKAVGIENRCRFVRGSRPGDQLTVEARPADGDGEAGRRIWTARITDAQGRLCAESRVVLALVDEGREIGGDRLSLRRGMDSVGSGAH